MENVEDRLDLGQNDGDKIIEEEGESNEDESASKVEDGQVSENPTAIFEIDEK